MGEPTKPKQRRRVRKRKSEKPLGLKTHFDAALAFTNTPSDKSTPLDNTTRLMFYGLFKQVMQGPCNKPAPSRLNIVARAKWNAWHDVKSLSTEEAMTRYISELEKVQPDWKEIAGIGRKIKLRSKL